MLYLLLPSASRLRPSKCLARPVDLNHMLVVHSVRPAPGAATEEANVLLTLLAARHGKGFQVECWRDSSGPRRISLSQAGEVALCDPIASTRLDRRQRGVSSMGRLLFRTRPVCGRCRRPQPTTQTPVVQPDPAPRRLLSSPKTNRARHHLHSDFPSPDSTTHPQLPPPQRPPDPATAPPRWWGTETRPDPANRDLMHVGKRLPLAGFLTRIAARDGWASSY